MKKKITKLRLGSSTIRTLVSPGLVLGGQLGCTTYTHSDVKSECATMCVDCP